MFNEDFLWLHRWGIGLLKLETGWGDFQKSLSICLYFEPSVPQSFVSIYRKVSTFQKFDIIKIFFSQNMAIWIIFTLLPIVKGIGQGRKEFLPCYFVVYEVVNYPGLSKYYLKKSAFQ